MKMTSGWLRFAAPFALVLTFAAATAPAEASAQDDRVRAECRCVDADGNEIEACSCFRSPRIEDFTSLYGVRAERPRLGVSVNARQDARYDAEGAYVTDVLDEGPAWEAGIREGDVITSIDGRSLTESIGARAERDFDLDGSAPVQRLLALAGELEEGQRVEVEYLRDGEAMQATLEADDLEGTWGDGFSVAVPNFSRSGMRGQVEALRDDAVRLQLRSRSRAPSRFETRDGQVHVFGPTEGLLLGEAGFYGNGLQLVEVNPELGSYFGAEEGVLVVDAGRATGLGLRAGDVVLRVGDRRVDTPARFRRILASYGAEEDITFHIRREGADTSVTGRMRY